MVKKNESPRIGISDLETRLNTTRQTIGRWVKQGRFPAPHYLGQRRLWFIAEIERFEAGAAERALPAGLHGPTKSSRSKRTDA